MERLAINNLLYNMTQEGLIERAYVAISVYD
jgi:hypothetical protein